jgi:hypothetical protein
VWQYIALKDTVYRTQVNGEFNDIRSVDENK